MFFPQFLSFKSSGAASHTVIAWWQETLSEHRARPWLFHVRCPGAGAGPPQLCPAHGHPPKVKGSAWASLLWIPSKWSHGGKVQTTAPESFLWTDSLLSVPKYFWFCAFSTPALRELGSSLLSQSLAAQAPFPQVVCAPVPMGSWCELFAQHILDLISYCVFL